MKRRDFLNRIATAVAAAGLATADIAATTQRQPADLEPLDAIPERSDEFVLGTALDSRPSGSGTVAIVVHAFPSEPIAAGDLVVFQGRDLSYVRRATIRNAGAVRERIDTRT